MNARNAIAATLLILPLAGCLGYSKTGNEAVVQVKSIHHVTPLLLPNYDEVDVSFGTIRNGVGSVSKQDLVLYVSNPRMLDRLNRIAQVGGLAEITYSEARFRLYGPQAEVTDVRMAEQR